MVSSFTFACSDAMALSWHAVAVWADVVMPVDAAYNQTITKVRSLVGLNKTRTLQKIRNELSYNLAKNTTATTTATALEKLLLLL